MNFFRKKSVIDPEKSEFTRDLSDRPSTEKSPDLVRRLIASWRNADVSVVFGNLGRRPFLLDYYFDACFSPEENVKMTCSWNLSSEYQSRSVAKGVDFSIIVEPYFGFTVHRDRDVKHLVILTSHLSLYYGGSPDAIKYFRFNVPGILNSRPPNPNLENCEIFKPPAFHNQVYETPLPQKVLLDVTDARTAHEAYLKLLTGREIIRNRPYKIEMRERDRRILKINLKLSERHRERVGKDWNEFTDSKSEDRCQSDYFLYMYLNRI